MEQGFLSQKGSGGGRGVKEKNLNVDSSMHEGDSSVTTLVSAKMNDEGTKVSVDATKTLSDVNSSGPTAHIVAINVTVNMAMKKQSSLVDTTSLASYPPLPKQVSTSAGNAYGKSSYANVIGKPSGKKLIFHTLFTPEGNGIDVVVPVESIRTISERFANTIYGVFLGKRVAYPVVANYVKNTWGKYGLVRFMFSSSTRLFSIDGLDAMLENGPWFIRNNPLILRKWHPDENLLKEDVSNIPVWVKHHGVPFTAFSEDGLSGIATKLGTPLMLDCYTTDMCMQSWRRPSYARAMIELRADVELKNNIVAVMPKINEESYYTFNIHVEYEWKPPRCACCKDFGLVLEECTKNIGAGATKNLKKTKSTKEVSKSNPFEVLTSIDNDVDLGTNGGISNSADKGTINVSSSNTPIGEKIDKIERQICEGKLRFVDDDGNPLVPTGIVDSDSEVEVVFDETANLRISKSGKEESDKGYGTNSLLEQWMDSNPDNDDYDHE
ncbi:beta-caryophyllene synthase [Tanacetum coccineum]